MSRYHNVIGFEIHVQLKTESKMFCPCSARYFGANPNTHVCPTCLGLPGALPTPNAKAIESTIRAGLALGCEVNKKTKFDRKSYFYPDLPKGYQISQYELPLCREGKLSFGETDVPIRRVHIEEDTGKMFHDHNPGKEVTLIDFNRSGVPLMEIVTDIAYLSSTEARLFLKKLTRVLKYLDISDCSMETGSMRLEVNISLTPEIGLVPDYKVEIKNLNSFRFVESAIDFEINRQSEILNSGCKPVQETRGWDEKKKATFSQRSKEHEYDYRYFPEPDIPHIEWTDKDIQMFRSKLPALPDIYEDIFTKYGLDKATIEMLLASRPRAELFERCVMLGKSHDIPPTDIASFLRENSFWDKRTPEEVLSCVKNTPEASCLSAEETGRMVETILSENPELVSLYKSGRHKVIEVLIGRCNKMTGRAGDLGRLRTALTVALER